MFAKDIEADFKVELFLNSTLFKQGTELVALQRDNLEMGNIAPQDISKQVPAWSILTSAYLFRDANHLNAFFASEQGAQMKKMVEDQVKVKILGPDLLRHAPGGPEAEEEDQHAGRPGRHQAAHAARRRLAAARPLARRQPDADGLRRDLHRAADRRHRRPGQPAAERAEHEVLRGDVADRADLAPGRLRPADGQPEDLAGHVAGASRRRSRPPPTRPSPGARPSTRKREAELAEGFRKQGLEVYAPEHHGLPRATRRRSTWRRTKRRTGRPA